MGKFVVVYKGGAMAEMPETQEVVMKQWMDWFDSIGSVVTDFGNPFGSSKSRHSDGSTGETTSALTGYTILEADSLEHAGGLVADCPVLAGGGSIEIYEAMPM